MGVFTGQKGREYGNNNCIGKKGKEGILMCEKRVKMDEKRGWKRGIWDIGWRGRRVEMYSIGSWKLHLETSGVEG